MFYVITVLDSCQYPQGTLPALISQTACTNYWKVNFEAANIPYYNTMTRPACICVPSNLNSR